MTDGQLNVPREQLRDIGTTRNLHYVKMLAQVWETWKPPLEAAAAAAAPEQAAAAAATPEQAAAPVVEEPLAKRQKANPVLILQPLSF